MKRFFEDNMSSQEHKEEKIESPEEKIGDLMGDPKKSEKVYVVTNLKDGSQEVIGKSKMKERFTDSEDAETKGFKVVHHFGGLFINEIGTVWGRSDTNYSNFRPKSEPVYDKVSEEYWCEMEFVPDEPDEK